MPAISIIVPIYNVEQYLRECINSILVQTFKDFELILVDDGSSDDCGKICDECAQMDKRIKVIHKENGGLSDARNAGIDVAQGEYLGFVDSDDWIQPNMYEVLYTLCIEKRADISTCRIITWENAKLIKSTSNTNNIQIFNNRKAIKYLYDGRLTGFSACNKLYKKSVFKNTRFPKGRIYEDAAIMYKVFFNARKIVVVDSSLYNYRIRELSITRNKFTEKRFDVSNTYIEAFSYMKENYPEMCEALNYDYFSSLRSMLVDIIHEKGLFKNYKHVRRISNLVRKSRYEIFNNSLISTTHKILAIILAWCPIFSVIIYKVKGV